MQAICPNRRIRLLLGHILLIVGGVAVLVILTCLHIPVCPLRIFLPVGCPFCGMTRAHIMALGGDPFGAFAIHPLYPLGLPYLWLLFHETLFKGKGLRRWRSAIIILLTAALLAVYILRIVTYVRSSTCF